jgi:hypothetical protein
MTTIDESDYHLYFVKIQNVKQKEKELVESGDYMIIKYDRTKKRRPHTILALSS